MRRNFSGGTGIGKPSANFERTHFSLREHRFLKNINKSVSIRIHIIKRLFICLNVYPVLCVWRCSSGLWDHGFLKTFPGV